jgi:hypothetical protein
MKGNTITAELLKNEFLGVRPNRKTICQAFVIHLTKYKERVAIGNKASATPEIPLRKSTKNNDGAG